LTTCGRSARFQTLLSVRVAIELIKLGSPDEDDQDGAA
jgi:hypothetical protein